MEENKKMDFQYKPNLKPDENYLSSKVFEELELIDEPIADEKINKYNKAVRKANEIIKFKDLIPDGVGESILSSLPLYLNDYKSITEAEPSPSQVIIQTNDETEVNELIDDDIPELFPTGGTLEIEVEENDDILKNFNDNTLNDKENLYEQYFDDLHNIVSDYVREVNYLAVISGFRSLKDMFYAYSKPKDIEDQYMVLSDSVIRGQIAREQRTRFFNKVYNIDKTMFHLRQKDASEQLRNRYFNKKKSDYIEEEDYLDSFHNKNLKRSRNQYKQKYEDSIKNFYKYLNTSVQLTNEILKNYLDELTAKANLLKHGVDIFAGNKSEEAKKAKVEKQLKKEQKKKQDKATKDEEKRMDEWKEDVKKDDDEVNDFFSKFETNYENTGGGDEGSTDDSDVIEISGKASEKGKKIAKAAYAIYKEHGVNSANPWRYSMALRNDGKHMDCSLYANKVVKRALNINIPNTTEGLRNAAHPGGANKVSSYKEMRPGDLILLKKRNAHVMIYIDDGKVLECCPTPKDGVQMNDYKRTKWCIDLLKRDFLCLVRF